MKDRLLKLAEVKSIVTLTLNAVFCALAFVHAVSADQFVTIFTTVIAFYFGTQSGKEK